MEKENLIEILNIGGNEVSVERIDEKNFKVNLTQLGLPYGQSKRPKYWLELKSTKEYLLYRQWKKEQDEQGKNSCFALEQHRSRNSCFDQEQARGRNSAHGDNSWEDYRGKNSCHGDFDPTYGGQIIVKQGGNPYEQGTWCTDFHIALDYVAWLDPKRKDAIYDVFIAFLNGQLTASEIRPIAGVYPIIYKNRVFYPYLEILNALGYSTRSGSVAERKRMYPSCIIKLFGRNFITVPLIEQLQAKKEYEKRCIELKSAQLSLTFKEEDHAND